jgi:hypothetical protein
VDETTNYIISGESVDFISTPETGLFGLEAPNVYFDYDPQNKVYSTVTDIVISFNEEPEKIAISINNHRKLLSELDNVIITMNKNKMYTARINFSKMEDSFYDVYFINLKNGKTLEYKYKFIFDRDFNFKTKHIKDNQYEFLIDSSIYEFYDCQFILDKQWEFPLVVQDDDLRRQITYILNQGQEKTYGRCIETVVMSWAFCTWKGIWIFRTNLTAKRRLSSCSHSM